jgi:WD40 repeat protein
MWDLASSNLLFQRLDGFEHMARSLAFSPDGRMVAVGTGCVFDIPGSAFVKVWEAASGALIFDIPMPSIVLDVAFSPDGRLLAAAGGDGTIKLLEVASGRLHGELRGHEAGVSSVAFSPDGERLVSGGFGGPNTVGDARLWDVKSGEQLYLLDGHSWGGVDVVFSTDGQMIVTGGGSHTLIFWDAATGEALAGREVGAENNSVYSVAFNGDSTVLATCDHDQRLRLWGVPASS